MFTNCDLGNCPTSWLTELMGKWQLQAHMKGILGAFYRLLPAGNLGRGTIAAISCYPFEGSGACASLLHFSNVFVISSVLWSVLFSPSPPGEDISQRKQHSKGLSIQHFVPPCILDPLTHTGEGKGQWYQGIASHQTQDLCTFRKDSHSRY